jgi:malate dehydrogenase
MRKKVTVVGAGFVGATTAQRLAENDIADVVLIDIPDKEGPTKGKALDMMESAPLIGFDANITGTADYADIKDSDVVVITAGIPRKPGMSREDLIGINANIVKSVSKEIKTHAPNAIVIMVSNPVDVTTYVASEVLGFPHERVIGMAGVLDAARYRSFISMELNVSMRDVNAMVLGGHGDQMVPLPQYSTVSGIPITELMDQATIDRIVARTRKGGGEIVNLLGDGSAYYAPSASVVEMVDSILFNRRRLLPIAAYLNGQYGLNDLYIGVPVYLGPGGVDEILELKLSDEELSQLHASAETVKQTVAEVNL